MKRENIDQFVEALLSSIPLVSLELFDPEEFEQEVIFHLPLDILEDLEATNYLIKIALKKRLLEQSKLLMNLPMTKEGEIFETAEPMISTTEK